MSKREYRQDDRDEGYCPVCANPLTGLTVAARGYCEEHGWQWADWQQHEKFKQAIGDLVAKMEKIGND